MKSRPFGNLKSVGIFLMGSTALAASGTMTPAFAQATPPAPAAEPSAPAAPAVADQIKSITVVGTQRLEADTVRSYIRLRTGQPWTQVSADQALKDLYATEL
ncbi:MAG: outer rane assembly complex, YaeT protein, partial [Pseudomonadota bacterium]